MGPVDPARSCCHKRDYFGQHSRFSFPLCSEKKNRRTAVFRAERSAKEAAVSAKDSAASDAEPFAVTGTLPHIRQMPRPERRGWRSISFFKSNVRKCRRSIIDLHVHNKTVYQATTGLLFRTGEVVVFHPTSTEKFFVDWQYGGMR